MKLFTCGPVQMYPSTANVRNNGFIHFRTKEFGAMVVECLDGLSKLLGNNERNATIYLASSGTGAMEATVENCISDKDKCLVINGGGFGKRFCELLEYHDKNYSSVDIDWDETLTQEHLKQYENKGYTTLFVNIHETTSGQLYDIKILSDFCQRNGMYLIVDAISSFLADEYDMDKYGVDVTIISSQKGLCLSPGMAVVSFSMKMIEKIQTLPTPASIYFDFKDYLKNIPRGQTPYTPPICIMYELQDMLKLIKQNGGLKSRLNLVKEKCDYFRNKIKEIGLKVPDYPKSNMLTPVEFNDVDAYEVIQVLKDKYQMYVNPCGGALATKLLRVSHIGNTTIEDIDDLIEKILLSVEEVKNRELVYDRK